MKKLCIYFFSGTGMTKYVVDKFVNEFEKNGVLVDRFKIEGPDAHQGSLSEYDALGIAYPVHSFNAPKIVIDFVKQLPKSNGMNTFIIHTAGEESIINFASSDLLIKKLCKRGYKVFHNKLIEMPSNFVVKYEEERVRSILGKANEDIPHIANEIMGFGHYDMQKTLRSRIIAFVGRIEWFGARTMGKSYYADNNCVRCGHCINICPNKNIVMNKNKNKNSVAFKWRCGLCMRCIYQCPKNAISIRRPFKFIRFDSWYDEGLFEEG